MGMGYGLRNTGRSWKPLGFLYLKNKIETTKRKTRCPGAVTGIQVVAELAVPNPRDWRQRCMPLAGAPG
jgi:hypothetical protein